MAWHADHEMWNSVVTSVFGFFSLFNCNCNECDLGIDQVVRGDFSEIIEWHCNLRTCYFPSKAFADCGAKNKESKLSTWKFQFCRVISKLRFAFALQTLQWLQFLKWQPEKTFPFWVRDVESKSMLTIYFCDASNFSYLNHYKSTEFGGGFISHYLFALTCFYTIIHLPNSFIPLNSFFIFFAALSFTHFNEILIAIWRAALNSLFFYLLFVLCSPVPWTELWK